VIWLRYVSSLSSNDGEPGTVLAWCAFVLPISLAYAYLSARLVELPVRRWARHYGRRAQAAGEAGAS
jgi:peptidoglycan/LPS O-acetylase OafA/YrhL